jgi:hypothetical protein
MDGAAAIAMMPLGFKDALRRAIRLTAEVERADEAFVRIAALAPCGPTRERTFR